MEKEKVATVQKARKKYEAEVEDVPCDPDLLLLRVASATIEGVGRLLCLDHGLLSGLRLHGRRPELWTMHKK